MHIVTISSEVAPFSKTGGLGDVAGALPVAYEKAGHQSTVITPLYRQVRESAGRVGLKLEDAGEGILRVPMNDGEEVAGLVKGRLPGSDVTVYFLENDYFFDRSGLYVDPKTGEDYRDNSERFIFLSRGAVAAYMQLGLEADVLHSHDWQAGLVPAYHKHLYAEEFAGVISVFTVHNIAFPGIFARWDMRFTGLPHELFNWHQLEFFGNLCLLKAGLVNADGITTVSKQYAREIQTEAFGMKMEGIIRERSDDLRGIVNGVDYAVWNPETDEMIPANFSAEDPGGKSLCKAELQKRFALPVEDETPLVGMIGRLVHQKGYDLVLEQLEGIMKSGLQMVLLGEGDPQLRKKLARAAGKYPEKFAVKVDFDEKTAHLIEAGADMFLMPSRYEPCGLNQLFSMKYGTVPLVSDTGGLADTVKGYANHGEKATGFVFKPDSAKDMVEALNKALNVYNKNSDMWRRMMQNGMREDWSWDRSASEYLDFFREKLQMVP